jgi:hypothetical protein
MEHPFFEGFDWVAAARKEKSSPLKVNLQQAKRYFQNLSDISDDISAFYLENFTHYDEKASKRR